MATTAQWALERFCGTTARMAHSRVNANVNVAINSQLGQQENALRFTLPDMGLKTDNDYTDMELEKGVDIADLFNGMIKKLRGLAVDDEDEQKPITLTLPTFDELEDDPVLILTNRNAVATTCTLAEKHNYRKMSEKQRREAAELILTAEHAPAWNDNTVFRKMAEIEISEIETIENLHTLPIHIRRELTRWIGRSVYRSTLPLTEQSLESVLKYKVCKLVTTPVDQGPRRRWMIPDAKKRITGKEQRRNTNTRSSSLISYKYTGRRGRTGTGLAEVEFFVSIALGNDVLMLAYVRALPTTTISIQGTTDSKLVRLSNPVAFDVGEGRRHFIECAQIVDLAGLIRDRLDLYVIGRESSLNLTYTE